MNDPSFFVLGKDALAGAGAEDVIHGLFDSGDAFIIAFVEVEPSGVFWRDVEFAALFHVAEDVSEHGAERVPTERAFGDGDAVEELALFGDEGNFVEVDFFAIGERDDTAVGAVVGAHFVGV